MNIRPRTYALIAGWSYLVIFCAAIFANFVMLDAIIADPVGTITEHGMGVRLGIMAFLLTAVFDVFVAWALYELYRSHPLSAVSACFRVIHATIMGAAVFALPLTLSLSESNAILRQVDVFNTLWLIGLFFFGVHLILLGRIIKNIKIIPFLLMWAGVMYIIDTSAHFLFPDYQAYAGVFLALVALPSILGEMSFAIWLLIKGGK